MNNYYQKYLKYKSLYFGDLKPIKAVCVLKNNTIDGVVYIEEIDFNRVKIYGTIKGLTPNKLHAIHIHETGDLTEQCKSCCAHYNPFNKKHGGPNDIERHVGDLGNIYADGNGIATFEIIDNQVKLRMQYSVIGRSFIVHKDTDDLGKGGHPDSHTTGHAGDRIACGVIGYARVC